MAFFSFDGKVQAILIAGALAAAGCGGTSDITGDTGVDPGTDTGVDTATDTPWIDVDPPPDVLDVPDSPDSDVPVICTDPGTPALSFAEVTSGFPVYTLRATLDVDPADLAESSPAFSAEKGSIAAVRRVSAVEYEIDYRWDDAAPMWSDWDRVTVAWNLRCVGTSGSYERTIDANAVLCIMSSAIYMSWDNDPDSCMMADPPPPPCRPGECADADEGPGKGAGAMLPLPRGALRTSMESMPLPGGRIGIKVAATGPAAAGAAIEWRASAGSIEASGGDAVWTLPAAAGMHTLVAFVRSGSALSVEVLKVQV